MEKYLSENLLQAMLRAPWELECQAKLELPDKSEKGNAYTIYLIANVLLPDKTMQLLVIIL